MHSDMSKAIWKCMFWNPPAFLLCHFQERRALRLESLNLTHKQARFWVSVNWCLAPLKWSWGSGPWSSNYWSPSETFLQNFFLFLKKCHFIKTRLVCENVSVSIKVLMGKFLESRVDKRGRKRSKACSFLTQPHFAKTFKRFYFCSQAEQKCILKLWKLSWNRFSSQF